MTLKEYCDRLGWPIAELARQARIDWRTANKAISGEPISARAAREIARALSEALGRRIDVGDIEGLNLS
jgi:tetrahydromethanopterin S-methyltransferase subunit E